MRRRIYTVVLVILAGAGLLVVDLGLRKAISSAHRQVGAPPDDVRIEPVAFSDRQGRRVSGWAIDGDDRRGVVLLLHGIRSDRRSMLSRARFLSKPGYSVLMIDLAAHGESDGDNVSFGYAEAVSVSAAISFAKQRWPAKKLGIVGQSLGGVATVFAQSPSAADAVILEAVYSSLWEATENRLVLRLGTAGRLVTPFLMWQLPLRLGFWADELSVVDRIGELGRPVLIIAGAADLRTTLANSRALFASARHPKQLWVLPGARHQDFHRFAGAAYETRVLDFFARYLK